MRFKNMCKRLTMPVEAKEGILFWCAMVPTAPTECLYSSNLLIQGALEGPMDLRHSCLHLFMVYLMTGMNLTEFNRNTAAERRSPKHTIPTEGFQPVLWYTSGSTCWQSSYLLLLSVVPLAYKFLLCHLSNSEGTSYSNSLRITDAAKLFEPAHEKGQISSQFYEKGQ